jgi:hypothetical protein
VIEIKDLLLKFNRILLSEEIKKELIQEVILKTIKIPIKKEEIKIKNGTVFLKIKPIYKNEIFINRDKIFLEMEKVFGKKMPKDFR